MIHSIIHFELNSFEAFFLITKFNLKLIHDILFLSQTSSFISKFFIHKN